MPDVQCCECGELTPDQIDQDMSTIRCPECLGDSHGAPVPVVAGKKRATRRLGSPANLTGTAMITHEQDLLCTSSINQLPTLSTGEADMAPANDPNFDTLHELAELYRQSEAETKRIRQRLDALIQELKREGYSFPVLARESGLAQGTIQNIVAKDQG